MNTIPKSILTINQTKRFRKDIEEGCIVVKIRHDDSCKNGHNTFAITGTIYDNRGRDVIGGCIHDEIVKHFPELEKYIKWHNCSTDTPLYYIANTLYHVSDKCCWGKRKGEPSSFDYYIYFEGFKLGIKLKNNNTFIKFLKHVKDGTKQFVTEIKSIPYINREGNNYDFRPRYTINPDVVSWYDCEFDCEDKLQAQEMLELFNTRNWEIVSIPVSWSEGKEIDLDAARRSAIPPDATIEQLSDKKWLEDRLPSLLEEFKKDVEELGFIY